MSTVYLLQNQHKLILNRNREWTDARDLKSLYQTPHKDEGINQKVEVNAKDYTQRIHLLECELNDKRLPIIAPDDMPEPLPDAPAGQSKGEQASLIDMSQTDLGELQDPGSDETDATLALEADEQADDAAAEFDEDPVQD